MQRLVVPLKRDMANANFQFAALNWLFRQGGIFIRFTIRAQLGIGCKWKGICHRFTDYKTTFGG
jgi:hypothetical protein